MTDQEHDDIAKKVHAVTQLFHNGRLVGSLEAIIGLMEEPAIDDRARCWAVAALCAATFRKVKGLEDQATTFNETLADHFRKGLEPNPAELLAIKTGLQALCTKMRQDVEEDVQEIFTLLSPMLSPGDARRTRIEYLLKELDSNIMARTRALNPFNPELMKYFDEQITILFQSLAQYGIKANTVAEAQQQFEHQFGGQKGETIEEKIRRGIKERRRMGAGLEADRAALVKEFPDQEAFINAEYRKEQANLRRSM